MVLRQLTKRYAEKLDARHEISGPNGQQLALQADVLINALFIPARLEKLSEPELQSLTDVWGRMWIADWWCEGE
jgi:hypothetical protein